MKRWEAWTVHLATLLVGGTGVVYAILRYCVQPTDEFAVVNHPLQPTFQHFHVLLAPLLVFAAGLIWRHHVWAHWRAGVPRRRRSGLTLLANLAPMIASGYLIQTTVSPFWRKTWVILHLVTSALWLVAYGAHFVAGLRRASATRRRERRVVRRTALDPY